MMLNEVQLNHLHRYCVSLCHHSDDAYDLLQSAIEKFLSAKPKGVKNIEAYLRMIARNLFIDDCRRKKIVLLESIEDQHELLADDVSLESMLIDERQIDVLMAALQPFERETLFLSAVMGYSAEEIAQQQAVPRGTVLSRLFRVKKKAQKLMTNADKLRPTGVLK